VSTASATVNVLKTVAVAPPLSRIVTPTG